MTSPISSEVAAPGSARDSRSRDATRACVGSATMPSVTFLSCARSIDEGVALFIALEHPPEPRLQGLHGARVDLRDARFGDVERFADLLQRHLFVVVERHDQPLLL